MDLRWLQWCRFYFSRAAKAHPLACSFLTLAVILLAATASIQIIQFQSTRRIRQETQALGEKMRKTAATTPQQQGVPADFPTFDPVKLVESLNRLATQVKLPLDEISFILEDNPSQPYLRYRVTLTVSSGYLVIRRFVDDVQNEQPQVTLDAINCVREDISTTEPTCDLNLSAFYRKPQHG